ncbi:SAP domain-containing protein [Mammaliicoccus sciuri]|uniref:SAP domain-containing protein n=1 Tax=Mammaliicoccus sciuri TaxID=1296 RepID=UPI003A8F6D0A
MNLPVYDLLALHLNINRTKGNESNPNYFTDNNINVMQRLKVLEKDEYLILKTDPTYSLQKLKIPELKDILRANNLKLTGKKQDLINRILDNLQSIDSNTLNLPAVYVATDKGKDLIEKTPYVKYFLNEYLIGLSRAHQILKSNINVDDQIEFVYLTEIKYELHQNLDNHRLSRLFESLAYYYLKADKDFAIVRKYYNLSYFVEVSERLPNNYLSLKSDDRERYQLEPNFRITEFYESQLLVHSVPENSLVDFFVSDITEFYEASTDICEALAEYLIAYAKKDNQKKNYYAEQLFVYGDQMQSSSNYDEYISDDLVTIDDTNNNYDQIDNIKIAEQNKYVEDTNPNNTVKDTLWGCGCLLFIVLAIAGCSAIIF